MVVEAGFVDCGGRAPRLLPRTCARCTKHQWPSTSPSALSWSMIPLCAGHWSLRRRVGQSIIALGRYLHLSEAQHRTRHAGGPDTGGSRVCLSSGSGCARPGAGQLLAVQLSHASCSVHVVAAATSTTRSARYLRA